MIKRLKKAFNKITKKKTEKDCLYETFQFPKVSIIVPSYDCEKYIFKCLLSLVCQTLKEIEIIVINDGSTDNTPAIINEFVENDNRIRMLSQENKKQGAARNKGLQIAKGEYIAFVDSDDWLDLDYIEKLYSTAKKHDADIITTNLYKHKKAYSKYNVKYNNENIATTTKDKIKLCEDRNHRFFYVINKLYKKEFLDNTKITFPENKYFEDVIFSAKTIFYANKVVSCPSTRYHYNKNTNSTVNSCKNSKKKQQDKKEAYIELHKFANENSIKLPECINYSEKYWNGVLKFYKGSFKTKILLFGIIPIFVRNLK